MAKLHIVGDEGQRRKRVARVFWLRRNHPTQSYARSDQLLRYLSR